MKPLHQFALFAGEGVGELFARDRQGHNVIWMLPPANEQTLPWGIAGRIGGLLPKMMRVVADGSGRALDNYRSVGGFRHGAHR